MARKKGATVEFDDELDLDELASQLEDLDLGDEDIDLEVGDDVDIDLEDDEEEEDKKPEPKPEPKKAKSERKKSSTSKAKEEVPPPAQAQDPEEQKDPKQLLLSAIEIQRHVVSASRAGSDAKKAALDQLTYMEGLIDLLL